MPDKSAFVFKRQTTKRDVSIDDIVKAEAPQVPEIAQGEAGPIVFPKPKFIDFYRNKERYRLFDLAHVFFSQALVKQKLKVISYKPDSPERPMDCFLKLDSDGIIVNLRVSVTNTKDTSDMYSNEAIHFKVRADLFPALNSTITPAEEISRNLRKSNYINGRNDVIEETAFNAATEIKHMVSLAKVAGLCLTQEKIDIFRACLFDHVAKYGELPDSKSLVPNALLANQKWAWMFVEYQNYLAHYGIEDLEFEAILRAPTQTGALKRIGAAFGLLPKP
jgi:hypothetical protein